MAEKTKLPRCNVQMRNGSIASGEIFDVRGDVSTVRINTEPKQMPGAYGLQPVNYQYIDVQNKFVSKINL